DVEGLRHRHPRWLARSGDEHMPGPRLDRGHDQTPRRTSLRRAGSYEAVFGSESIRGGEPGRGANTRSPIRPTRRPYTRNAGANASRPISRLAPARLNSASVMKRRPGSTRAPIAYALIRIARGRSR